MTEERQLRLELLIMRLMLDHGLSDWEFEWSRQKRTFGADPRWQDVGFAPIQPARGKNADPDEWPTDLRVRQFPASPDREGR